MKVRQAIQTKIDSYFLRAQAEALQFMRLEILKRANGRVVGIGDKIAIAELRLASAERTLMEIAVILAEKPSRKAS